MLHMNGTNPFCLRDMQRPQQVHATIMEKSLKAKQGRPAREYFKTLHIIVTTNTL